MATEPPACRSALCISPAQANGWCAFHNCEDVGGQRPDIVEAFAQLREAAGCSLDGVDANALVCELRHDDGCQCARKGPA